MTLDALTAARANTSGVFTLEQLQALGQTGDTKTDFLKSGVTFNTKDPAGLLSGAGRAVLSQTDLPAGYYQIPGVEGAEFFDPHFGQASQEFVDWVNSGKMQRDPFTGVPHGFIPVGGGPQAANAARADQQASEIAKTTAIIAGGKGADGTYQDSQDRVLGIGKYQQFMLDANGKQIRVADALAKAAGPATESMYRDMSSYQSKFTFHTPTGANGDYQGYWMAPDGSKVTDYSQVAADTQAAVDANTAELQSAYNGLAAERIARGEDPNTGVSLAETKNIYETYGRIEDPAERAAYIKVQDPGNLTPDLREARKTARGAEENWMMKNQAGKDVTYENPVGFGGQSGDKGQVKTTYGDVMMNDAVTGRDTFIGNVPVDRQYISAQETGAVSLFGQRVLSSKDSARINGGIQMFMAAAVSGGILGLGSIALGASSFAAGYMGAGGWLPNSRNISLKNGKGFGDWRSGSPQEFDATTFLIGLGVGGAMNGIGSFATKFFSPIAAANNSILVSGMAASGSFASRYGMAIAQTGLEFESAAKGRQTVEDLMAKRSR